MNLQKHGVILKRGERGSWDAGMIESPVVWFDTRGRRFGMVYTGYARIREDVRGYASVVRPQVGLAWSDDLLRWEKDPRSPIFGPSGIPGSPDEEGTPGPFVHEESGKYFLFYFGTTRPGYEKGVKTLNLATSTNLTQWERFSGNPIVFPSGSGWRRDALWHPNVVKSGHDFYLFVNASGVVDGIEEEYIGFAVSHDLYTWEVRDKDSPLLVGSRKAGAWDSTGRTGDPSVFRVGSRWFMAYYSWNGTRSQDGLAWTSPEAFPLGWTPFRDNPVLRTGAAGTFDALHAAKPYIIVHGGTYYHFYTAVAEDERREIALATADVDALSAAAGAS